jgi:hypothetical protein
MGSKAAGTTMALKASNGSVAFLFTIPQTYSKMLLSAPDIATGTKYTIYTGGTPSGYYEFNGLYLSNLGYSGGTGGTSFTVNSRVTDLTK